MSERLHCGCDYGPAPCGHDATQEDLLCDECRRGECRQPSGWSEIEEVLREIVTMTAPF